MLLVNGKKVVVEQVQHEILESPLAVYNLEVEGNHNYYVAENSDSTDFVLVHNKCGEGLSVETNDWGPQHGCDEHWNAITKKANELQATGKYDKIYVNKSLKTAGLVGKQRPDVIAIGKNGVPSEIWEFASPSQASNSMFNKLCDKFNLMLKNNPSVGGKSDVIPWEEVLEMFMGK